MRRDRKKTAERGYGAAWRRLRAAHLRAHPLCAPCQRAGRTVLATVVDHIIPHRGDRALLLDPANLESQCTTCHSGDKQRAEKGGGRHYRGADVDGTPLDPEHHWRRRPRHPRGGQNLGGAATS